MSTNASGTTEHYGLSQWAEDDLILRQDFNHDNAAIDAALHAQQTAATTAINALEESVPLVRLASQTLTAAAASISISLSGITLSNFQELQLIFSPLLCTSYTKVKVRFNGDGGNNYLNYSSSSTLDHIRLNGNAFDRLTGKLTLWNGGSYVMGDHDGATYSDSGKTLYGLTELTFLWKGGGLNTLTSIQLIPDAGSIGVGTRISLYGLKK